MNFMSLFAGIGGLDLGLERSGMKCVAQVEIDPFCRRVLAKHWPEVPRHDNVRTCVDWWRSGARPPVHVVAGGFPCQPFAKAGRRLGAADERWGWPWMFDVVRELRPDHIIVENTADLLDDADAFGWMLGDLARIGFDAEWSVLSACTVGAPHARERLFVVAHTNGSNGSTRLGALVESTTVPRGGLPAGPWTHPVNGLLEAASRSRRVAHGLPDELEPARVRALGNAIVPQVAEHIGRLVMAGSAR